MIKFNLQHFATGDPITVVNSKIATLGTSQVLTLTAADQTTDATAQKFVYTPTGKDNKICFVIYTSAGGSATVAASLSAGTRVFGAAAKSNTIPATAGHYLIQCETGKYMLANGTIELTMTPPSGKDLVNDYALKVGVIELQ
jgi:hypothetical protein